MTFIGIKNNPKPNYVALDTFLPKRILKGSISVSLQWEGHPTGSLSIQSVPETEIDSFREEYDAVGRTIILFSETSRPIYFEIAAYAETEDSIFVDETVLIKSFDISVSLRGGNEKRVTESVQVRKPRSVLKSNYAGSNRTLTTNKHIISNTSGTTYPAISAVQGNKLSLKNFATLINVDYAGYSYAIDIPEDAGSDYRLSFDDNLRRQLRTNGLIVDYSEPTIKTRDYKAGKVWRVSNQDILSAIDLSKQQPYEYRDTILTGKDGLPFLSKSQLKQRTLKQLLNGNSERKPPEVVKLVEGDENPTIPPPDVKKITTLDMNFDFSGPRKTIKETTTYNGQTVEETLTVYGFAYLGQEIRNYDAEAEDADFDVPAILATSPATYWTVIEYLKTTYEYDKSTVTVSIKARDKETNQKLPVKFLDGGTSFRSRYLTSITTTGWKLARFQQEQFDENGSDFNALDSRWLTDEINDPEISQLEKDYAEARLKSITFRRLPYYSTTQYKLIPSTNYYEDEDPVPYQTQEVDKADLGYPGTGKVVTALPDPSFVYPMLVLEERILTQSFDQMDHPENILIRDERKSVQDDSSLSSSEKVESLKDLKLLPWLTTGEDTYRAVLRKILPSANTSSKTVGKNRNLKSDVYIEYEYGASNHDAQFQYSLQEGTFRTVVGRPSGATSLQEQFENTNENDEDDTDPFNYEYLISSTNDPFTSSVESLQYDTSNLSEGLRAAKADLEINNFLNVSESSINLAWFYPEVRPGDYIELTDDLSKGRQRIKSVNFTIEYQDYVNGLPHRVCNGTSVVCGRFEEREIYSRQRQKDDSADDVNLKSRVAGEDVLGKSVYKPLRSRRNPSGQDIE